jgi:hypothetical protein
LQILLAVGASVLQEKIHITEIQGVDANCS